MYDFNGFDPADNNGKIFDPLSISWWLFENTGNPEYYMLYRDFFEAHDENLSDDERRK